METIIRHGRHNTADPGTEAPGLQGGTENPQDEIPFLVLFLKKYFATPLAHRLGSFCRNDYFEMEMEMERGMELEWVSTTVNQ